MRIDDEKAKAANHRTLITAAEIFPAMEDLVIGAEESVYLALHIFSPRTKTRSSTSHNRQIVTWGQLIADRLEAGVRVRLLINDFDPIGAPELHASVWERIAMLDDALKNLSEKARKQLKLIVALPGGQSGTLVRTFVWPAVRKMAKDLLGEFSETGRDLPPGLREHFGDGLRLWPPVRNYTQSLHQKFIVVDGKEAIVGGLDIDERRFDDPDHRRKGEQTWHDVSLQVDGEAARQLDQHFIRCWRLVHRYGRSFCKAYVQERSGSVLDFFTPRHRLSAFPDEKNDVCDEPVVSTLGLPRSSLISFGPTRHDRGIIKAHLDLIKSARKLIYIENQFLRSSIIRDALIAQLGTQQDLHVIVLLPAAPDSVAFEGQRDAVNRYGEWLQTRILERLSRLFPERFDVFCLTNERDREESGERDALHGKAMVYIHSKVLIADDARSIVSSANLNGRSMEWDYEVGILSDEADDALALRDALWRVHLGEPAAGCDPCSDPAHCMAVWRELADERKKLGKDSAKPGVVPFPIEEAKRFSKRHFFIPQQMV